MKAMRSRRSQRGVTAVEFGLIAIPFILLLIGVIEMGRLLWTWNAAVEATRLGARLAVVCDVNRNMNAPIKRSMRTRVSTLTDANITITYMNPPDTPDAACTNATCKAARVALSGYTHNTLLPRFYPPFGSPMTVALPDFSTSLRKEFMSSASNEICPT